MTGMCGGFVEAKEFDWVLSRQRGHRVKSFEFDWDMGRQLDRVMSRELDWVMSRQCGGCVNSKERDGFINTRHICVEARYGRG